MRGCGARRLRGSRGADIPEIERTQAAVSPRIYVSRRAPKCAGSEAVILISHSHTHVSDSRGRERRREARQQAQAGTTDRVRSRKDTKI